MRTGCPKATRGASKNLMWGALKHIRGASEHRSMGVLRGTLDRGPLKNQIGSCIWDNVKDVYDGMTRDTANDGCDGMSCLYA